MSRKAGDWDCTSCHYLNFSWRDSCQRCNDPRARGGPGSRGDEGEDGYGSFRRGGGSDRDYGRSYGGGLERDYGRSYGGGSDRDYGRSFGGGGGGGGGGADVRPGDWYCSTRGCGTHNFSNRSSCFKCGALKDDAANDGGGRGGDDDKDGGYEAGGRNSRGSFDFGSSYNSRGRQEFKSGDWICGRNGCKEHNFANRSECFRCHAPRESGTAD